MKKIAIIVGTRPNFVKAKALQNAADDVGLETYLIHTNQHYDYSLNTVFFNQLEIPKPKYVLDGVNSGNVDFISKTLPQILDVLLKDRPEMLLVVGDVNSTLAGALVARDLRIPLGHVEAGLRSFDMRMPEEINRRLVDTISDYFFITEPAALTNLKREGHAENIYAVGNVMLDTLRIFIDKIDQRAYFKEFDLVQMSYAILTLHRPGNVDNLEDIYSNIDCIKEIPENIPLIFPVHPRAKDRIKEAFIEEGLSNVMFTNPLGYLEFLSLVKNSLFVVTDSGGIQEETTYLGVPCLTLRENTERPITISSGSNRIIGKNKEKMREEVYNILGGTFKMKKYDLWDGFAAKRIMRILKNL